MMESEKVKEILKFCSEGKDCYDGCPYKHDTHCVMKISKQALTLINKLEKENEELKQDLKKSIDMQKEMLDGLEISTKEVEENLAREIPNLLKQFAERLKEKCEYNKKQYCCEESVSANDIDETLKEFLK